jgi:N-succinyldiaminopimelate aminotransferase
MSIHPQNPVARRIAATRPSALRALRMRALALKAEGRQIVDLASGNSEHEPPQALVQALASTTASKFAYGDPRGQPQLRQSVADTIANEQGISYDADSEVTIVGGATGGLSAALMGLVDPGVGIAVFTPFYEGLDALPRLAEASVKYVRLRTRQWTFDENHLATALSGHVRFLLLNNPHNPTGRNFTQRELETIARICREKNITVISDEAYESFWFARKARSIATLPGMRERTVVIHSWSKAFNAPGLKIGSIAAPAHLMAPIRQAADLLSGAPATVVQDAFAEAMPTLPLYAAQQRRHLKSARNELGAALSNFGFTVAHAQATTSLWAGASAFTDATDLDVCEHLLDHVGIVAAPGRAFLPEYLSGAGNERQYLRFSFNRSRATIEEACRRLSECHPFCVY